MTKFFIKGFKGNCNNLSFSKKNFLMTLYALKQRYFKERERREKEREQKSTYS